MRFERLFMFVLLLLSVPAAAQLAQGTQAPAFKATDIRGQEVDIEKILTQEPNLLILLFFQLDSGRALAEKLEDVDMDRRAHVVAVGYEEDREDLAAFADEAGISYYVIPDSADFRASDLYGPLPVVPMTFFISNDLHVVRVLQGGGEGHANIINRIAQAYLQQRDAAQAEAAAQDAVEAGEDPALAMETVGYAKVQAGDLDAAEEVFSEWSSKAGQARVALAEGELDRAIALADEAGPEDGYGQAVKGMALLRKGQIDAAQIAFDAALKHTAEDWQSAEAQTGRGRTRHAKGDVKAALADYREAASRDLYSVAALSNASAALREEGDLEGAKQLLESASKRGVADDLAAVMLEQIQQDLESKADTERRELIRKQIQDLEARYREQQETGDTPDEWTSRPMVVAFLEGESNAIFERAGADAVLLRGIASALPEYKASQVVEREMLDALLQELNLATSDLADPVTQARLGKVLSARYLVFSEFARAGNANTLFLRLVDPETTQIVGQVTQAIEPGTDMSALIGATAKALAEKLNGAGPLQGRIAALEEEGVLLNLGEAHGVKTGDTFHLLGEPKQVEVGGRTLTGRMPRVGMLRVISVDGDLATAEIVELEDGAAAEAGAMVLQSGTAGE